MKLPSPTEYDECLVLVEWLDKQKNLGNVLLFSHIPNETYTTSWKQKAKNKNSGVRRGVPDYIIVMATGYILFVEMKRISGSTTAPEQKEWIKAINLCDNCEAKICKGSSEAIKFIEEFLPALKMT